MHLRQLKCSAPPKLTSTQQACFDEVMSDIEAIYERAYDRAVEKLLANGYMCIAGGVVLIEEYFKDPVTGESIVYCAHCSARVPTSNIKASSEKGLLRLTCAECGRTYQCDPFSLDGSSIDTILQPV
jgi:hypothetical protein